MATAIDGRAEQSAGPRREMKGLYDPGRLQKSIEWAELQLEDYRKTGIEFIRQFVGHKYKPQGGTDSKKYPINMMEFFVTTLTQKLAASPPRVLVETFNQDALPKIDGYQFTLNREIVKMNLLDTINAVLTDSFFYPFGVARTGISYSEPYGSGGYRSTPGTIFTEHVPFDCFVCDMTASSLEEADWYGHEYDLFLEDVLNNEQYEKDARDEIRTHYINLRQQSQARGRSSAQDIGVNYQPDQALYDKVRLYDIYIPKHNILVTITENGVTQIPLRVIEWAGPKGGPYTFLSYYKVPKNIMPLQPVASISTLNDALNQSTNKLLDQVMSKKRITVGPKEAEEDNAAMAAARDGDHIGLENYGQIQDLVIGEIDNALWSVVLGLQGTTNEVSGNILMLGGSGRQGETLGQDQLSQQNASGRVLHLERRFGEFVQLTIRHIGHWIYTDPVTVYRVRKKVQGIDLEIESDFGPEDRADAEEHWHDILLIPYSMQNPGPAARLQMITNFILQVYPAVANVLREQGRYLDADRLISTWAAYTNMPDLDQIFLALGTPGDQSSGDLLSGVPKARTPHEHIHRSGNSGQGNQNALLSQLAASSRNPNNN